MKQEFIKGEAWALSISGAFQRNKIYIGKVSDADKKTFKNELKIYLDNLVKEYKFQKVSELSHVKNITDFCEYSAEFSRLLKNGKLNFGTSQKLINLYLKYLWCLDYIIEPPHFPVDRIIQVKLKFKPIIAWTQITTEKEYMNIINFGKKRLGEEYISLPELELKLFNRRNDYI